MAKDHKKDFYSSISGGEIPHLSKMPAPKSRLVNSVSTNYNIISHAKTDSDKYERELAVRI